MKHLTNAVRKLFDDPTDPVRHCKVHRETGCAHVDGFLCDMSECQILKERLAMDVECPVCGYYCNGNGGIYCIDKPKMCGKQR